MIDMVKNNSKALIDLCEQYSVKHLELFGSAVTEDDFDPQTSDIYFLVEFLPLEPRKHAKCYFGLLEKLQDTLGQDIDLVL